MLKDACTTMISAPASIIPTERRRSSILRRQSTSSEITDGKSSLDLLTGVPHGGPKLSVQHTWNPREAAASNLNRRTSKNIIDGKSLYSIRREHIASREMSFVAGPSGQKELPKTTNVEQLVEKIYIVNSRLSNATPEKFPRAILKKFHRVSGSPNCMSYGMPRPPSRDKFQEVMEGIKREPSIVRIEQYPSLQEPVHCSSSDEFCEILGPSSCTSCIENTNRHIGEQLQDMVFPMIDITSAKLIAPKLSKLFRDGHKTQLRKKRMRELGFNLPDELGRITRSETHLSSSTCMRCKKPLTIKKLKVTTIGGGAVPERLYKANKSARFS